MSVRGLAASAIFVVMLIAALALWTAIPLGWIWIGSKVAETQFPAEGPYAVVAVGIIVSIVADAWLIGRLNALYVQVTGTNRLASMRPSWLKSVRDTGASAGATTVVEAVMVASAMLAGLVLIAWFFFLAGSPLPDQ
jgi:DNA-binding transcriptional regulator YbjK